MPAEAEAPQNGADATALQPDEASLRGNSLEVSCPANGDHTQGTAPPALHTTKTSLLYSMSGPSLKRCLLMYGYEEQGLLLEARCLTHQAAAGAEATEVKDSSIPSCIQVLPVCKEAEADTGNTLDKEVQGVLRRGKYSFARSADMLHLDLQVILSIRTAHVHHSSVLCITLLSKILDMQSSADA